MAQQKIQTDTLSVDQYIQNLDPAFAELVNGVRKVIMDADERIGEQIKWNAPSFFFTDEMEAFDPKTYKRDIVVMNLRKGNVLLIFPTGDQIKDTTGILSGDFKDGRRMLQIDNSADLKSKSHNLTEVIRLWLNTIK